MVKTCRDVRGCELIIAATPNERLNSWQNIGRELVEVNPRWSLMLERANSAAWISGQALQDACAGPLNDRLLLIGDAMKTDNRKVIAASFALRYAWSAAAVIAPLLIYRRVPNVSLQHCYFKFSEQNLFQRLAVKPSSLAGSREYLTLNSDSMACLREQLINQASPLVDALQQWSGFSKKALWGQISSTWASLFITICDEIPQTLDPKHCLDMFFDAAQLPMTMKPEVYPVTHQQTTRLYQRRSSCCLYYKISEKRLFCSSCPLLDKASRLLRNQMSLQQLADTA